MKKAIGLVVFVFIMPFIVNMPDEKLRDEAEKIISSQPKPLTPQTDNGFYALLGFEAPKGKGIYQAGKDMSDAYADSQEDRPAGMGSRPREMIGLSQEMPDMDLIPKCIPEKQACLRYYSEKEEQLLRFLETCDSLLERYGSLKKYAFFQDMTKPGSSAQQMSLERGVFAGHLLTVAHAAHLFNRGNHGEAIQLLVSDIGLWRRILAGASDLSIKTSALLSLRLSHHLLDEMLQKQSKEVAAALIESPILASLSMEEKSTSLVWNRHFRELAWSLINNRWPPESEGEEEMSFLERSFTKTNATLNEAYALFFLLEKLSTVEPEKVEDLRVTFSQRLEQVSKLSLRKLYNPLGKAFIASSFDERVGVYWNRDIHSLDRLITRVRSKVEH